MAGVHSQKKQSRTETRSRNDRGWVVAITVAAVAVLAVAIAAFAMKADPSHGSTTPTTSPAAEIGVTTHAGSFRVIGESPANGTTQVPSDATVSVEFSEPLAAHSPTPSLQPAVAGSWQVVTPDTYAFVASAPLVPSATETVTVPGGANGITSLDGRKLVNGATFQFTVAQGSTLRLQQLLAQLGYLPVSFTPAGPLAAPQEAAQPQQGSFNWRWNEPAALESQWTQGASNVIDTGAVMAFESQHGLTTDGLAGPGVWSQLLAAAAAGTMDPNPYNYVYVSEDLPETATVYSNGSEVYSTLANTGVPAAATTLGTFPVYARYVVTTMRGTNPDGSKYVDPGIPWVSYFNGGDALHGFVRGSYGFPQSDGCVEMPPSNAAVVFPLTPIGTLVTVS
jgi:peptidoglycan hydrolase-like protein with peptidoglycan-binding domain